MNESEIFTEALKLPTADRAKFLDSACKDSPQLRAQVEDLLRAHFESKSFLRDPDAAGRLESAQATTRGSTPKESAGTIIAGKYKLLDEPIGEGGMGTVWMAEQRDPVKRLVAVKLIKAGMDSRAVLARFEAERSALALMDHPNIARIFDGGLTESGAPFFVMELVKGIPITDYCDAKRLTPNQRLELFVPVCQAIQHAHQKGVIHRDIKPSNVLITQYDDCPVPKIIDFGLAKALGPPLTDHSLNTGFNIVGTPQYMSPEQATFNQLDIDTRSDVYSLGALLYELLAGSPPFKKAELAKAGFLEILRIIREEDPPRPSTKLSTAEGLPSISANRATEPKRLTSLLRNELDWIVMKALEKDRSRRYESAASFAVDIARYLADEPILAAPPSAAYRFRKFVRRHRASILTLALLTLFLFVGSAVSIWQAIRATKAEVRSYRMADNARTAEKAERVRAESERLAREQAEKRLAQIENANLILGSIFDNLNPDEIAEADQPLQAILVDQLDQAVKQLEGEAIGDPLVVASMQQRFGFSLMGLGEFAKAAVLLEKSLETRNRLLGPDHPETLQAIHNLGVVAVDNGQFDKAIPLLEEALRKRRALLGSEHIDTLTTMNGLARALRSSGNRDAALSLYEEAFAGRKKTLGADHPHTITSMNNLATAYQTSGKLDQALPLFEQALNISREKHGLDHPITLRCMGSLAQFYLATGKLESALPLFQERLRLSTTRLGPDHVRTIESMSDLANGYLATGQFDLAIPLGEDAFKLQTLKLGAEHPSTISFMDDLATIYQSAGKRDLALPLFEEALRIKKKVLGPAHSETLESMRDLATAYSMSDKMDLAIAIMVETLDLMKEHLGPDHPDTLICMNNLAESFRNVGELDLALPLAQETYELMRKKLGPNHPYTLSSLNGLALCYKNAGKLDLALPLFKQSLELREKKFGPSHPNTITSIINLAAAYQADGKPELAIPLLENALGLSTKIFDRDHPNRISLLNTLGVAYKSVAKFDEALPLFQEALDSAKTKLGIEHSLTITVTANLGTLLKDMQRLDESIALLEQAYRFSRSKPALSSIGNGLLEAYAQANKVDLTAALAKELLAEVRANVQPESVELADAIAAIGPPLLKVGTFVDAEPLLRECRSIRERLEPDAWTTFNTQSQLGAALLGQENYSAAEPLLISGYEGMLQRVDKIPREGKIRLSEAVQRLIDLYSATDQPDKAAEWQKKLDELTLPGPGS